MGTVYKFEVHCVSAFLAFSNDEIKAIIENALKNFKDKETGMTLESIEIKKIGAK